MMPRAFLASLVFAAAGLCLVASACADDPPAAPPSQAPKVGTFEDGARLHAQYFDGGDGARAFLDWYDAQLGIQCDFVRIAQDAWACLPQATGSQLVFFADANCSEPLVPASSGPNASGIVFSKAGCTPETTFTSIVESTGATIGSAQAFHFDGYSCTPASEDVSSSFTSRPMDLSGYVHAKVVREEATADLAVNVLVADDGARRLVGGHDTKRDQDCSGSTYRDDTVLSTRCLPAGIAGAVDTTYFDGPDCAHAIEGTWECPVDPSCAPAAIGVGSSAPSAGCATTSDLFALGAPIPVYGMNGTCDVTTYGPCRFLPTTHPIATKDFPAIESDMLGTGRLRVPVERSPGEGRLLEETGAAFYDTKLGVSCGPTTLVDPTLYCVPETAWINGGGTTYFADANCTQMLAESFGCDVPLYAVLFHQTASAVYQNQIDKVYEVSGPFTGANFWIRSESGCVGANGPPPSLLEVGAEVVPSDEFATVTSVM